MTTTDVTYIFQDEAWQHIVEQFLHEVPRAAGTKREHRSILARCFSDPTRTPEQYSLEEIEAFASSPGRSPDLVQPGTVRHRLNVLSRFYGFVAQHLPQLGGYNPARDVLATLEQSPDKRHSAQAIPANPFAHLPEVWQRCIADHLSSIKEHSGSISSYRAYFLVLRKFFSGDSAKTPEQLTMGDIQSVLTMPASGRRGHGQPLSASSKNNILVVLKSFYQYCSMYDIEQPDGTLAPLWNRPWPGRALKPLKRSIKPRGMTAEEVEQFISAIPYQDDVSAARDISIFLAYWWTLRRRSELASLRWGDLRRITITESDGMTRREAVMYTFTPKGNQRARIEKEMPPDAMAAIEFYLEKVGRLATIQDDDPIWLPVGIGRGRKENSGKTPLSASFIYAQFQYWLARAGLSGRGFGLHSLRHSGALIRFLSAGQSSNALFEVQQALGHKNAATSFLYLQPMIPVEDKGYKRLQGRFSKLTPRKEHHS